MGLHPEVLMAVGYAAFLLGLALGMDFVAHRAHVRSERYRTAGFAYHHTRDAWFCPEDQVLLRSETDHERRLVRYRGRPRICNRCPAKAECTDSDDGRELVRAMDPWPHSEAGRFHRGISLAVALVAAPILAAVALRNHAPLELAVLGAALLLVALMWRLHAAFRATPANFPDPKAAPPPRIPAESLRMGYGKDEEAKR